MDCAINTNGFNGQVIQTEDNVICYQDCIKKWLHLFLWFNGKKAMAKIDIINIPSYIFNCMIMI